MLIAVLSDIHGNLEALHAVCADMDAFAVERVACLGDMIGYGPNPEEVLSEVRERGMVCCMGNHELGIAFARERKWFNTTACKGLNLTADLLSAGSLAYISALPRAFVLCGATFVHGFPPEHVVRYLFETEDSDIRSWADSGEALAFVGHTHELMLVTVNAGDVLRRELGLEDFFLEKGACIVNAGSVGQPRDGNNNAKYLLWDTERGRVTVRFVPYDIAATVRKMTDLGFPAYYASRLW